MTKTHIFLDVDGVLNQFPGSVTQQEASGWGNWRRDRVKGYWITWSKDMVAALNELAAREDVQFHWLTTWEEYAAVDLAPVLGLEGRDWPVVYRGLGHINGWWKTRSLSVYLGDWDDIDRFVWVDDDHAVFTTHGDLMREKGKEVLVVAPATETALTREQFDLIVDFVDKGAEAVVALEHEQGQPQR